MKFITGLFKPTDASKTVDKLMKIGLTADELSIVSSAEQMPTFVEGEPEDSAARGAAVGPVAGGAAGALGTWVAPAIPGSEAMFASGMLTTAAGGVIGAFLGSIFSVRSESQTQIDANEALAEGKVLLIAKVIDENVSEVITLFEAGKGEHIETHELPEREPYQEG